MAIKNAYEDIKISKGLKPKQSLRNAKGESVDEEYESRRPS